MQSDSVRKVVDAVFKQRVYDRSVSGSLWRKFIELVGDMIRSIARSVREVPTIKWALIVVAAAVLLTIAARAVHLARNETRVKTRVRTLAGTQVDHLLTNSLGLLSFGHNLKTCLAHRPWGSFIFLCKTSISYLLSTHIRIYLSMYLVSKETLYGQRGHRADRLPEA